MSECTKLEERVTARMNPKHSTKLGLIEMALPLWDVTYNVTEEQYCAKPPIHAVLDEVTLGEIKSLGFEIVCISFNKNENRVFFTKREK